MTCGGSACCQNVTDVAPKSTCEKEAKGKNTAAIHVDFASAIEPIEITENHEAPETTHVLKITCGGSACCNNVADSASTIEPIETAENHEAPKTPDAPEITQISEAFSSLKIAGYEQSTLPPTLQRLLLTDKVAVVTGGARGLGYCIAEALCEVGVKAIVILDVLQELGDVVAAEFNKKFDIPAAFYKADVRDSLAVKEVFDSIATTFGSVDVLICSAGIADSNIPAETYDIEMFRRLIDINLTGTFLCAQAAGKKMIEQGKGGSIICIASMSGHIVNWPQQQSCYNASKAGVIQLTKSLAAEWAGHKIRVNSISPGYMDTALNRVPALDAQKKLWCSRTPMNRLGNVDELNNLAVFLASDASTYMTGSDVIIDGGYCAW